MTIVCQQNWMRRQKRNEGIWGISVTFKINHFVVLHQNLLTTLITNAQASDLRGSFFNRGQHIAGEGLCALRQKLSRQLWNVPGARGFSCSLQVKTYCVALDCEKVSRTGSQLWWSKEESKPVIDK